MGRGATATLERLAASLGRLNEVTPRFDAALDIAKGGVLLALPALLATGLLRHASNYFRLPKGFYGLSTIFLLLAVMALARLRSIEALRYYAPGEWGKLLGIDRAPEVRTLRLKLKHLADQDQPRSCSWTVPPPSIAQGFQPRVGVHAELSRAGGTSCRPCRNCRSASLRIRYHLASGSNCSALCRNPARKPAIRT